MSNQLKKDKIKMKDYKRIRVLFSDHLGLARGKYQPTNNATTVLTVVGAHFYD